MWTHETELSIKEKRALVKQIADSLTWLDANGISLEDLEDIDSWDKEFGDIDEDDEGEFEFEDFRNKTE
ncbi:MAG: hypothetical protein J4432_02375 [DPANN group archaeon]|nr:hypothetical protein [DPANN group archaeon]